MVTRGAYAFANVLLTMAGSGILLLCGVGVVFICPADCGRGRGADQLGLSITAALVVII